MKLTMKEKIEIIELREKGKSNKTIAKQFKDAYKLIQTIWYAYELHIKFVKKNKI